MIWCCGQAEIPVFVQVDEWIPISRSFTCLSRLTIPLPIQVVRYPMSFGTPPVHRSDNTWLCMPDAYFCYTWIKTPVGKARHSLPRLPVVSLNIT